MIGSSQSFAFRERLEECSHQVRALSVAVRISDHRSWLQSIQQHQRSAHARISEQQSGTETDSISISSSRQCCLNFVTASREEFVPARPFKVQSLFSHSEKQSKSELSVQRVDTNEISEQQCWMNIVSLRFHSQEVLRSPPIGYLLLLLQTRSTLRRPWSRLSRHRQNGPVRALRSATATLGLGSLHQKPRVGGTLGGSLRDGSDGWRSPVPRGDNTGGEFFYLFRQPSLVGPADSSRAS